MSKNRTRFPGVAMATAVPGRAPAPQPTDPQTGALLVAPGTHTRQPGWLITHAHAHAHTVTKNEKRERKKMGGLDAAFCVQRLPAAGAPRPVPEAASLPASARESRRGAEYSSFRFWERNRRWQRAAALSEEGEGLDGGEHVDAKKSGQGWPRKWRRGVSSPEHLSCLLPNPLSKHYFLLDFILDFFWKPEIGSRRMKAPFADYPRWRRAGCFAASRCPSGTLAVPPGRLSLALAQLPSLRHSFRILSQFLPLPRWRPLGGVCLAGMTRDWLTALANHRRARSRYLDTHLDTSRCREAYRKGAKNP